jgi:hypothetical protein
MLAFDLHGVIMYVKPALRRYYAEDVGFELQETNTFNYPYPEWYDPRQFGPDIARAINKYGHECEPMAGSVKALRGLYAKGIDIVIVTASAKSTMLTNKAWLDVWIKRPYIIHQVNSGLEKKGKLLELGVTHFVDDRYKTCADLVGHLKGVYLYDAVHNRGREQDGITRVTSLREVINLAI